MPIIREIQERDAENLLSPRKQLDEESKFMLLEPGERRTTVEEQRQRNRDVLSIDNQAIVSGTKVSIENPWVLLGRRYYMQKWEYLFVSAEQSDEYRVRYINGKEVPAWERGDDIYTFANKMGDEGWELVSAPYTSSGMDWATSRLIFRRPK